MTATVGHAKKRTPAPDRAGEPAWDIARLFPPQGQWTEADYLALDRFSDNWLLELADGCVEVLPMPDMFHQDIVQFLFLALSAFVSDLQVGRVFFAPLPVRLWPGKFREPDLAFIKSHRIKDKHQPSEGADLLMEVVSPGEENRERDLETKRREYARAKIPEYWIVDPETRTITVLTLSGRGYKVHGVYNVGDQAASKLLKGFRVAVADVFAAGERK